MDVSVTLAGEAHRFALYLAPEGVATPLEISLPAVTRAEGEAMLQDTPATWLWNAPPPPPAPSVQTATWLTRF